MSKRAPKPDCYDYIRGRYTVPAYVGVAVRFGPDRTPGVLVNTQGTVEHYLHVRAEGHPGVIYLHPTDNVTYELVGAPPVTFE